MQKDKIGAIIKPISNHTLFLSDTTKGGAMALTLRTDLQQDKLLEEIKIHTGETAATKAIWKALESYLKLEQQVKEQNAKIRDLENTEWKIKRELKNYFDAESELRNLSN